MRAIYLEDISESSSELKLSGEKFHHLRNVLRMKEGDELLLLNGKGLKLFSSIQQLKKREAILVVSRVEVDTFIKKLPDVAIGLVKREALELCLKIIVETGVESLHLLHTQYSQRYSLNWNRINKILESAYEQSNRAFKVKIHEPMSLSDFDFGVFSSVSLYESQYGTNNASKESESSDLILIGPEGGFSKEEFSEVSSLPQAKVFKVNTPIMRAPTALSFALGQHYLF